MMSKIFLVLLILLVCSYINTGKAEKSEEIADKTKNSKSDDDEDESASIQVVQRDVVAEQQDVPLVEYSNNLHEEENDTKVQKDTNTNLTKDEAKYDAFFEDLISDSGEIPLENRDDNNENVSIPGVFSDEENNEYSNGQDKIVVAFEDITKAYNHDEKSQEDSTIVVEDENNWRSAENYHSDENKYANEAANEENVEDDNNYSVEDYADKKIDLEVRGRMETGHPEIRQYFNTRPINVRHYVPPEDHGMLDSGRMRSFGKMVVPRYRPVLTRTGFVYTPTLFPMQTGSSLLDRLSGRNWVSNGFHTNQEAEAFKPHHNRIIGVSHYEDSKMIDDYNDYGPNTNTYSYTPARKVTTEAPPQQIVAPNKFDVFQKLVEASNHPKSQKRTFNEFPGNYHTQRQYPEGFGAFNIRRVRRNAWVEPPFHDI